MDNEGEQYGFLLSLLSSVICFLSSRFCLLSAIALSLLYIKISGKIITIFVVVTV